MRTVLRCGRVSGGIETESGDSLEPNVDAPSRSDESATTRTRTEGENVMGTDDKGAGFPMEWLGDLFERQ